MKVDKEGEREREKDARRLRKKWLGATPYKGMGDKECTSLSSRFAE